MAQFRKKPVVIEAEQYFNDTNWLPFMTEKDSGPVQYDEDQNKPYIQTLEGKMWVNDLDYVIKCVNGEFYPCKPDIFEKTYDAV